MYLLKIAQTRVKITIGNFNIIDVLDYFYSLDFLNKCFIYLFICLFIYGCIGSSLLHAGFL